MELAQTAKVILGQGGGTLSQKSEMLGDRVTTVPAQSEASLVEREYKSLPDEARSAVDILRNFSRSPTSTWELRQEGLPFVGDSYSGYVVAFEGKSYWVFESYAPRNHDFGIRVEVGDTRLLDLRQSACAQEILQAIRALIKLRVSELLTDFRKQSA